MAECGELTRSETTWWTSQLSTATNSITYRVFDSVNYVNAFENKVWIRWGPNIWDGEWVDKDLVMDEGL